MLLGHGAPPWRAAAAAGRRRSAGASRRPRTAHRQTSNALWDRQTSELVESYARRQQEPRTVADQLRIGRLALQPDGEGREALIENARHVQRALPVRLARAVQQTRLLPSAVAEHDGMVAIAAKCIDGVKCLTDFEASFGVIQNEKHEEEFAALLRQLSERVSNTGAEFLRLRCGVGQARALPTIDPSFFDAFAARLLRGSVSWALPVFHHLNLHRDRGERHVGAYDTQLRPSLIARDCAFRVEGISRKMAGRTPRIEVTGDQDAHIEFVESHLVYILSELLKNSANATLMHHQERDTLPPVEVEVNNEPEQVVVTVTDHGGGMDQKRAENIFRYGYTTAGDRSKRGAAGAAGRGGGGHAGLAGREAAGGNSLAGWGFGLPRSKVYAQYLGGDLRLTRNVPGSGCTMRLTLPRADHPKCAEQL